MDHTKTPDRVRRLFCDGRHPRDIATVLGLHRASVYRHLRRLGLLAPRKKAERKPRRLRVTLPECWACGVLAPQPSHLARVGWHVRQVDIAGNTQREVYCPACFAQWGWPTAPSN